MNVVTAKHRRSRPGGPRAVLLLALLLVTLGATACGGDTGPSASPSPPVDTASVPALRTDQLEKTEAEREIESAGLAPVAEPTYTSEVPAGHVATQSPEPGTQVAKDSQVVVWISLGPRMTDVPKLIGEKGDTVTRLLKDMGLVGKKVSGASTKYAKGICYAQSPGPKDQVPIGTSVVYYVSTGLPTVAVPDLAGKAVSAAEKALAGSDLKLGTKTERHSSSVPKGMVISQSVPAGTDVAVGSSVDVLVSVGPAETLLTVPDVVGEYANTVVPELQMGGFRYVVVDRVTSEEPKGIIIKQVPKAGSRMGSAEELLLTVSGGPLFE